MITITLSLNNSDAIGIIRADSIATHKEQLHTYTCTLMFTDILHDGTCLRSETYSNTHTR